MVIPAMTTTAIRRLLAAPFAHLMAPDGLPRRFTSLVQDCTFLGVIHGLEHQLAMVMATTLGVVLVKLIALEVMQNLTAYQRDHVVQIELALVSARPPSDNVTRHVAG
jgi:hypothetical protein